MSRRYEKEFLISELKRFYSINKRIPKARELTNKNGFPNWISYRTHFGSLKNALTLAELPLGTFRIRPKRYSDLSLILLIGEFLTRFARYPSYSDLNKRGDFIEYPHVRTYESRFGGLKNAIGIYKHILSLPKYDEEQAKEIIKASKKHSKLTKFKVSCNPTEDNISLSLNDINHILISLEGIYCDTCNNVKSKLMKVKERK